MRREGDEPARRCAAARDGERDERERDGGSQTGVADVTTPVFGGSVRECGEKKRSRKGWSRGHIS